MQMLNGDYAQGLQREVRALGSRRSATATGRGRSPTETSSSGSAIYVMTNPGPRRSLPRQLGLALERVPSRARLGRRLREHEREEHDADHTVDREERRVETTQVAGAHERVLVREQRCDRGDTEPVPASRGAGRARPRRAERPSTTCSIRAPQKVPCTPKRTATECSPCRRRTHGRTASRRDRSRRSTPRRQPPSAQASHGSRPVIATHAPIGASPSTAPSQMWLSHVNRFRYG